VFEIVMPTKAGIQRPWF